MNTKTSQLDHVWEIAKKIKTCMLTTLSPDRMRSRPMPKGPTDADVRVLRVIPEAAEYWDTRGNSITVALKLAAARLAGRPPDLGENKKVRLR
jgi:general stress protein 26